MKKLFGIVFAFIFALCLTGCTNKNKMYEITKVHDYLYEIHFTDYRFDEKLETAQGVEEFACSSVKNGNFCGRNFDFIFNDVVEFVARVDESEDRHASISMLNNANYTADKDLTAKYIKGLELIPNNTLDGINDAGVIASINVVPSSDTLPVTGTNPDGEDLHMMHVVRFVLDHADSADNAIELLKERNIYGNCGDEYNIHVMIADKDKTYVVEFLDNKMVAEEKKDDEQIMTNFYVNLEELSENSAGVERYQILKENYDEGNTFEGMWNLLHRVTYSNAYKSDSDTVWYSEFLPQSILKNFTDEIKNEADKQYNQVKEEYWTARENNIRVPANASFWFTTHNSTYDINERKLRVTIQEDYDNYFEYKLD